jgi:hypothetical protein
MTSTPRLHVAVLFPYTSCAGLAHCHLNHPDDEKEHSEVMRMIIMQLIPMPSMKTKKQHMPTGVRDRAAHSRTSVSRPATITNRCMGTDPLEISPRLASMGRYRLND